MRREFGKVMTELAEKDPKIIILSGDYCSQMDLFRQKFPDKFYNLGICEQTLMGFASGVALEGFKPYVYSITPFLTERALEQIKLDIVMQGANVKIVGNDDYPTHGPTHKGMDVERIKNLLNEFASDSKFLGPHAKGEHITCYCPETSQEVKQALLESYNDSRPTLIRLKRDLRASNQDLPPIILGNDVMAISTFLTFRCNLNCSYCLNKFNPSFSRLNSNELTGEEWVKGLNRFVSRPGVPITFTGGEPGLHKDFIHIINNLKSDTEIDILTNLKWGEQKISKFISEINPNRIKRDVPYPSIRVSYHPEQMGDGSELVASAKKLQDAGFSIGIFSVLYPSPDPLAAIIQMQFKCANQGILFRLKDFTGKYGGETYGNFSTYPDACFQEKTKKVLCKTPEIYIGPNGDVYRCHRDLYVKEFALGNILDPNFNFVPQFMLCNNYGKCEPCDVKDKTSTDQKSIRTVAEIKKIT
ncbi:MAG: radical SAM protein [archaeon]